MGIIQATVTRPLARPVNKQAASFGPPYALPLIDGFQEISNKLPVNPDVPWQVIGSSSGFTFETSPLHVTYGKVSGHIVATGIPEGFSYAFDIGFDGGFDLTGYSSVSIDVYQVSAAGTDNAFGLDVGSNISVQDFYDYTLVSDTGAKTLTVDLTQFTGALTDMYFYLFTDTTCTGGEFYIGNLRAS